MTRAEITKKLSGLTEEQLEKETKKADTIVKIGQTIISKVSR